MCVSMATAWKPWARSSQGIVIAERLPWVSAGTSVLAAGGNALDAAAAVLLAAFGESAVGESLSVLLYLPGRGQFAHEAPQGRREAAWLASLQQTYGQLSQGEFRTWTGLAAVQDRGSEIGPSVLTSGEWGSFTVLTVGGVGPALLAELRADGAGLAADAGLPCGGGMSGHILVADHKEGIALFNWGQESVGAVVLQGQKPRLAMGAAGRPVHDSVRVVTAMLHEEVSVSQALASLGSSDSASTYILEVGGKPALTGAACTRRPAAVGSVSGGPAHTTPGINFFVTPI